MIKFKVVNKIPRILFRYKTISTNGQLAYKYFPLPTKPSTIAEFLKISFFGVHNVSKDELGILLSHDDIYQKNDIILAVGVGSGISLIHNCKKDRVSEAFIGIDGSRDQIEIAKDNARLNKVDFSKFKLIEGYVGNPTNIYGSDNQKTTKIIDINQFNFDILELDCEGSEIEILQDLTARPRHIIVEMHPIFRSIDIDVFLDSMRNKGYELGKAYTINGDFVESMDIRGYFTSEKIMLMKEGKLSPLGGLLVLNFSRKFD
jgi:hypothetical protein